MSESCVHEQPAPKLTASTRPWRAFGTWMATEVDGCTCAGFEPYGHEPHCGYEPMFQVTTEADAVAAARNADVAAAEARGRHQGHTEMIEALRAEGGDGRLAENSRWYARHFANHLASIAASITKEGSRDGYDT